MQKLIDRYARWLALIAGGVSATGFAPLNLFLLTLLCLALLMHLIVRADSGKRAFLIGWLFGVGHFTIGNNWIATAFTYQAAMPAWLGWIAVVALALYLAVYPALAAWGAWWLNKIVSEKLRHSREGGSPSPDRAGKMQPQEMDSRLRGNDDNARKAVSIPFILAFAGCWIISEWLRSWVFTGFAWNPLSAILITGVVPITPMIKWIGTYGVSGIILLIVGLVYTIMKIEKVEINGKVQRNGYMVSRGLIGVILLPLLILSGISNTATLPQKSPTNLTIVQPNISQTNKHIEAYEAVNFSRLAQQSRPLDDKPRILLWPEAAIPWWLEDGYSPYAYRNQPGGSAAGTRQLLTRLLGPDDMLLTGADRLVFDANGAVIGAHNSVFAIDKGGAIRATYDKAHLVPYGEYLALRWLLEPLGATRLVPGAIDFLPGPGPRTLTLGANKPNVGLQICYEIIFSGKVTDRVNRPDFLFNPSNDAWFGSWGPPQHLAQARLRAIEEGLPVVRSTPTGISAVIDANGRIVKSLPLGVAGRLDTALPPAKAPTLFARFGNILPLGFAALLIVLAFIPLVRKRTSR